ncbi:lymphocyte antigen 6 complex locus protein G6c [Gracilinanus agilis]|uniref:lymphocyte antigen 6 complex locus protein G6c n=1 Tax=Gracilinanus agilis TaxID=191870 RepID=UPI001CFE8E5C|nr:lymphocyte antigen 6 complex locus protein G6c [Gracilinanus agilis]
MNVFLLLSLSALVCWASADIRCHSCYKFPMVGCMDRKSCKLADGHQCMTTDAYLGRMWIYSNYDCGSEKKPCRPGINKTNEITYNTTCCSRDSCNSAPRPSPMQNLSFLSLFAGLGIWLLH